MSVLAVCFSLSLPSASRQHHSLWEPSCTCMVYLLNERSLSVICYRLWWWHRGRKFARRRSHTHACIFPLARSWFHTYIYRTTKQAARSGVKHCVASAPALVLHTRRKRCICVKSNKHLWCDDRFVMICKWGDCWLQHWQHLSNELV